MKILHIANSTRCSHIISQGLLQKRLDFDIDRNYVSFGKIIKEKSKLAEINTYDLIICGHANIPPGMKKYNLWSKVIFYEFRDSCSINNIMLRGLAYFKRSVTCGEERIPIKNKQVKPLNHCALEEYFLEEEERTHNIGCFFDKDNFRLGCRRANLINYLLEKKPFGNSLIGYSTGFAQHARLALFAPPINNPCMDYLKLLNKTKIIFTAQPGPTDGDWRTWEAFASGALVFKDLHYIPTPNMPIDGEHCFTFDASDKKSIDKAIDIAHYYLNHEDERRKIAEKGRKHIRKYHMAKNRINQILDVVKTQKTIKFI